MTRLKDFQFRLLTTLMLLGVLGFPFSALARPPLVVDFVSNVSLTATTRSFGGSDTHRDFTFKFTPLADTGLCEVDLYLAKYQGNLTGATVSLSVTASPSTPFFYSFNADTPLSTSAWTSTFTARTFTFYDDVHATNGTCPVMYGGHQYWLTVTPAGGSSDPRLQYQYWSPLNISQYTAHAWYRTDFSAYVQETTSEIAIKAYGFGSFAGLPGTPLYETADASAWVTSSSYSFGSGAEGQALGALGNMMRDLGISLFVPTRDSVQLFSDIRTIAEQRAPFAYVLQVQTVWNAESITSGSFPGISVPFNLGMGQANASISLFSLDAVRYYLPDPIWNVFKAMMTASVWLSLMYYIYRRVNAYV